MGMISGFASRVHWGDARHGVERYIREISS